MEKILVINSSPRKNGNSEILCDRLIEGAESKGACCEKINLREMNIGYCIGCDACRRNDGTCVIKDDMEWIFQKMLTADIVVLSTPVYFFTLSAQLKTLIDRLHNGYKKMAGKNFVLLQQCQFPSLNVLKGHSIRCVDFSTAYLIQRSLVWYAAIMPGLLVKIERQKHMMKHMSLE
mgnify:CR=1 FL=1